MTARRPLFRDGERLTAQRLNDAFGFVDDGARRTQLGTVGSGVASGFRLAVDTSGSTAMLRIEAGLAIDGAGRLLVHAAPRLVSLAEIEEQTGALPVGTTALVKVHSRDPAASSLDPCAELRPQLTDDRPQFGFSVSAGRSSFFSTAAAVPRAAALPAWSELAGASGRELGVTLGSITILSDSGGFSVSMAEREGLRPSGDVLHNSFGDPVMALRNDAGDAQVRLIARTYGDDITATRLGAGSDRGAAAVAPSDGRVLVVQSVSAVPVELDPIGGAVTAAGIPLEMVDAPAGGPAVRARRAGSQPSSLALGISAAPSYTSEGVTVVPVATAGLVEVRVRTGDTGVPLGAFLQLAGGDDLAVIISSGLAVARAAQRSDLRGSTVTIKAWVFPPQFISVPSSPT